MSSSDKLTWAFTIFLLTVCAVVLFWEWQADKDCEAAGGKRVRTTFSWECLKI